MFASNVTLD